MLNSIAIIGASARAAAFSAARAGFAVRAYDLFADDDLCALCPTERVERYPDGFEAPLRAVPGVPWMYTGGLENYPELVRRLEGTGPLYGNPANVLVRVRDPLELAQAVRAAGLPSAEVRQTGADLPRDGAWLRKPLRSAGGAGIRRHANALSTDAPSDECYFQKFVPGASFSGLYLAIDGSARLLGVTKQLVGRDWHGTSDFCYAGSIGPLRAPSEIAAAFDRLGGSLAERFKLRGLFGVDAIVNGDGVWPVEANPRFTASAELYDWALGYSTTGLHVAACQGEIDALERIAMRSPRLVHGKAIVFADRTLSVGPGPATLAAQRIAEDWPALADVPRVGSTIHAGQPVVTVFAAAESEEAVELVLRDRVAVVNATLIG